MVHKLYIFITQYIMFYYHSYLELLPLLFIVLLSGPSVHTIFNILVGFTLHGGFVFVSRISVVELRT
jgi:hypothetical protein